MAHTPRNQDPFKIPKPQAGFEYRWIADDPERLSQHLLGHGARPGYELVRGKNVVETRELCSKLGLPPEGYVDELRNRIRYGRLILARITVQEARMRRKERIDDALDARQAAQDEYLDSATRRGIKPFVAEEGEMEDRKRFAARDGEGRVSLAGVNVPTDE